MIIKEEFNRQKITEIKDKLIYDIEQINKGVYLNQTDSQTDSQTDYMNEINKVNYLIQELSKKSIFNSNVEKL